VLRMDFLQLFELGDLDAGLFMIFDFKYFFLEVDCMAKCRRTALRQFEYWTGFLLDSILDWIGLDWIIVY